MKTLILILTLLFSSCAVEVQKSYYHFNASVGNNGNILVSYCGDYSAVLIIGCDEDISLTHYENIKHITNTFGTFSFTRICTPMYFRIESPSGKETIHI